MSVRSEIFTNKGVETLKPFFSNWCISGNNVTISKIEVSLFPYESALSKYTIKHTIIIFEKRLIFAWLVTDVYNPFYYPLSLRKYGIRAILWVSNHITTANTITIISNY